MKTPTVHYPYRQIWMCLFLLFSVSSLFSQENYITVNGYIHHNDKPIENAYIEFSKDSVFEIFTSGPDGKFTTTPLPKGEYNINITHIAYKPLFKVIPIQEVMNFQMEISDHMLDEVTVQGNFKKALRVRDGNMILDPSFLGNIQMNSAFQLLTKIPGVNISASGITLNGLSSGLKIDGRTTGLSSSAINAYLKSIPADKIKEIVVMSSSASESASNVGGTINIVLKKEKEDSHSLNLGGNLEYVTEKLGGSSNGYYSTQRGNTYLSLFLEYENTYVKEKRTTFTNYSNKDFSDEFRKYDSRGNDYFGVLNLDYKFKNNDVIHTNASFYIEDYNRDARDTIDYFQTDQLFEHTYDKTKFDDKGDLFRIYVDYKTNDTLKLKHELGYGIVWGKSDSRMKNDNTTHASGLMDLSKIHIKNRHYGHQHQLHYDLVYSDKKIEFKLGARADIGELNPSSRYDSIIRDLPVYNPLFSSKYKLHENIYAAYASLRYRLNKISLYAGLRAEMTDMSVHSLYDNVKWKYNKTHLFPFVKISGDFNSYNTSLSLSTGIDRPPYLYYTPNYRYMSKYSYSTGNPHLLPSLFYKVGFENLFFDFLKIDFTYIYKKNSYKSITYNGEKDFEEITTYMNYSNENRFILNFYLPYVFSNDKISGYLGFYGQYAKLVDYKKQLNFYTTEPKGYVITNSTDYNITKNLMVGYSFKYQGLAYFEQTKMKSFYRLDLYCSYTYKKFTFGFQASDVLNKDNPRGTWYYVNNISDYNIHSYQQRFGINIRYNLLKGKKIKQRENKGANSSRFQ